jgi:hypothetical protein
MKLRANVTVNFFTHSNDVVCNWLYERSPVINAGTFKFKLFEQCDVFIDEGEKFR